MIFNPLTKEITTLNHNMGHFLCPMLINTSNDANNLVVISFYKPCSHGLMTLEGGTAVTSFFCFTGINWFSTDTQASRSSRNVTAAL